MKVFRSPSKNLAYLVYRIISPILDPVKFYTGVTGYIWFIRDLLAYKLKSPSSRLLTQNLYPVLDEKISFTPFDAHYYYQQLWVFEQVMNSKPSEHVDIASTYQMSGYLSKIVRTTFIDLRPIDTSLKNLTIKRGSMLDLPYEDNAIESLSCLHSIEHVGLGRYGDPIDPNGTKKACKEIARVLAKKGKLYISTPIGREKICFNAHRIHRPETIQKYFSGLTLLSFSVVDDDGIFHENVDPKNFTNQNYACGMFLFTKK